MEAVVRSFGLDALEPLTLDEGSGMFRPEVVLSWKSGSNHIFGELSRISIPNLCPGWHVIGSFGPENGRQCAHPQGRPVIFGTKATSHGPIPVFSS